MNKLLTWVNREPEIEVCVLYTKLHGHIDIHTVLDDQGYPVTITLDEEQQIIEEIILTEHGLVDEQYYYYLRDHLGE